MIALIGSYIFDTRLGKVAAVAVGAAVMFAAWLWQHDMRVADRATSTFATQVNKSQEKLRAKAVQARKPASEPGAAERLRKLHCRDC
jgi:hypothetical protein